MTFAKFDKKQQIISVVLGIVLIILAWQLYALFANNQTVHNMQTLLPKNLHNLVAEKATMMPMAPQLAAPADANANAGGAAAAIDPASNSQAEYLRLVNEYQMAQLQRMIAEDNEAIAIAKQNAAKAMSDTTKLLGDGSVTVTGTGDSSGNTAGYQLVYTGQQNDGQWTATVKKNNQTYDVVAGRQLPDGSQVMSIDENGVLLTQNNGAVKKLITFSGETVIAAQPPQANNTVSTKDVADNTDTPPAAEKPVSQPEKNINKPLAMAAEQPQLAKPLVLPKQEHVVNQPMLAMTESAKPKHPTLTAMMNDFFDSHHNKTAAVPEAITPENMPVTPIEPKVVTATAKPIQLKPAEAVEKKEVVAQKLLPFPAVAPAEKPPVVAQHAAPTAQELLTVNPDYFTIQLTVDHELQDITDFIKENHLGDQAKYFAMHDAQGHPLYVLIYGQYANAEDADKALTGLPHAAKKEGAFVAQYATVQTVIKHDQQDIG